MNNIKNIIYIYIFFYYVKFTYFMKRFEEEDAMKTLFDQRCKQDKNVNLTNPFHNA